MQFTCKNRSDCILYFDSQRIDLKDLKAQEQFSRADLDFQGFKVLHLAWSMRITSPQG